MRRMRGRRGVVLVTVLVMTGVCAIALAAGIADGLGFGDNTKAALMTRGIAEIVSCSPQRDR